MIVTCEKCSTKFKLADDKVTSKGVKVRCSKCQHVFVVKKEQHREPKQVEPAAGKGKIESGEAAPALPPQPGIGDDDIFSQPTRVAPTPKDETKTEGISAASPSPLAAAAGEGFPVPPPVPPAPPPAPQPSSSDGHGAQGDDGGFDLGSDLFKDLDDFEIPPPRGGEPATPPPELFPPPSAVAVSGTPQTAQPGGVSAELPQEAGLTTDGPVQTPSPATGGAPTASQAPPVSTPPPLTAPPATPPPAPPPLASAAPQPPDEGAKPSKMEIPAIPGIVSAESDDDPFAGLDLDAPSKSTSASGGEAQPVAGAPAPPPVPPPAGGEDLFGELGDSFKVGGEKAPPGQPRAAVEGMPGIQAPGVVPPLSDAPAGDPFAVAEGGAVDSRAKEAPEFGDLLSGNDPFSVAQASGEVQPSGLDLDTAGDAPGQGWGPAAGPGPVEQQEEKPPDGVKIGRIAPPSSPPEAETAPGGQEFSLPSASAVTEPPAVAAPASLLVYKVGFGLVVTVVALLLFVAYRSGGKPDLTSLSTYLHAFGLDSRDTVGTGVLGIEKLDNTTYPNKENHRLLVVWGSARNNTEESLKAVRVKVRIVDRDGRVLVEREFPAGAMLTPEQVYQLTSPDELTVAYRRLLDQRKLAVAPGKTVSFMAVLFDYPTMLGDYKIDVTASPANPEDVLPPQKDDATPDAATVPPAASVPKDNKAAKRKKGRAVLVKGDRVRFAPSAGASSGNKKP